MTLALRAALALFAVATLAVGAAFAVAPLQVADQFAIAATGAAGLGTLRADLGGCFIALGAFTLAGLRAGGVRWLTVPMVLIAAFLALRLLHLAIDGASAQALRSTAVEVVALALLVCGRGALDRAQRA
jgi:hypothetical protein